MVIALLCATSLAGSWVAAHQLEPAEGLHHRFDPERSWGSATLVDTLDHVALQLAVAYPRADPLFVGDLSRRGGGPLFGHITHDRGVDADLGLFTTGGRQPRHGFVDVAPEDLDLPRTWALIRHLLDTGTVAFILLDQAHIDRLRTWLVDDQRWPTAAVDAVLPPRDQPLPWGQRGVVRHAPNHRSHLHVRVLRYDPV